jgi:hypothetical protein
MTRLAFPLLCAVCLSACTPTQPSTPTRTCLNPHVVLPSVTGHTVGVVDTHGDIHFVPTDLPICPP